MTKESERMPVIHFNAPVSSDSIEEDSAEPLITIPIDASAKLASRSTILVEGTINGRRFRAALEPDGQGSHWFGASKALRRAAQFDGGDTVDIEIEPIPVKKWPEPKVPVDLQKALEADPQVHALWTSLTPMARWDWVRWTDTVKLAETRRERPEKVCSMLKAGKRRPCCFNRAARTPPKIAELF
jgi:hypothetical protein